MLFALTNLLVPLLFLQPLHAAPATRPVAQADCSLNLSTRVLSGHLTEGGACRYSLQYGLADRWEDGVSASDQSKHDITSLPPACPQTPGGPMLTAASGQNEQCLFGVIYAPKEVKQGDRLPVFVWIHGGSYYAGSASAPGLDGSTLAIKGNMIVIVLQYRLGVLGLLPPSSSPTSSDPSLAVKDVILALKQISKYAEWVGGDQSKVTIGGQSSGASLIRALLAAPQAKGLFRAAILQSDPMTYGTASANTTNKLQQLFYSQPGLSACASLDCLKRLSVDAILSNQARFIASAPSQIEGVPIVTPLRPTHNTPSIPLEPTSQTFSSASTLPNPPNVIPLLITTTANEAGQVVGSIFPIPIPGNNSTFAQILSVFVNPDRAGSIVVSPEYALRGGGPDELRETFERLVTDGVWRCASRDFAQKWAKQGGKVWVGEWVKGVGYVNYGGGGSYCGTGGRVCHEDDIFPTFQSASNPSAAVAELQNDVLARWTAFIHNLDPNLPPNISIPNSNPKSLNPPASGIAIPLLPGGIGSDRSIPLPHSTNCSSSAAGPSASGVAGQTVNPRPATVPGGTGGTPHPRAVSNVGKGLSRWELYTGRVDQVYAIGGGQAKGCPVGFWGEKVKYDWQLYQ